MGCISPVFHGENLCNVAPFEEVAVGKRRPMSKAETEVARLVWEMGAATARELHDVLQDKGRKIDYTTVQTYLNRLESKGYVASKIVGRAKQFRAKIAPSHVIREAVDDFVNRLFDGNALPLLRHLIEERGIETTDVDKLKEMLDQLDNVEP